MCFAEPGQVVSTDGSMARVATAAGEIDASLAVLNARGEQAAGGDWVVVALGLALERIAEAEARRLLGEHRRLLVDVGTADVGLADVEMADVEMADRGITHVH